MTKTVHQLLRNEVNNGDSGDNMNWTLAPFQAPRYCTTCPLNCNLEDMMEPLEARASSIEISKAISLLEELAFQALFRDGPWPADYSSRKRLMTSMERLGLLNLNPGAETMITEFGKACRVDLFFSFFGVTSIEDMPHTLLEHDLMREELAARVWLISSDEEAERLMKAAVIRAYRKICGKWRTLN